MVPGNFCTSICRVLGAVQIPISSAQTQRPAGPTPQGGARPPTPTGHPKPRPKPQVRESRAQTPKLGRVDVLIHFSQTNSNVMRSWCRPVAQPSPSWRRWALGLDFEGPLKWPIDIAFILYVGRGAFDVELAPKNKFIITQQWIKPEAQNLAVSMRRWIVTQIERLRFKRAYGHVTQFQFSDFGFPL